MANKKIKTNARRFDIEVSIRELNKLFSRQEESMRKKMKLSDSDEERIARIKDILSEIDKMFRVVEEKMAEVAKRLGDSNYIMVYQTDTEERKNEIDAAVSKIQAGWKKEKGKPKKENRSLKVILSEKK